MSAVFGVTGWKNSGKTTLVERLVAHFTAQGLRVSTIKRAHHSFSLDQPGTDTDRHRKAGARQVAIAGSQRWAIMTEGDDDPSLDDMLAKLAPCDLVLVEGYKASSIAKIECIGPGSSDRAPVHTTHAGIVALANVAANETSALPQFRRDDVAAIATFIRAHVGLPA